MNTTITKPSRQDKVAVSTYFKNRPVEQVEQIRDYVKWLGTDKSQRTSFYIQLGLLKGFKWWCIDKGYVDKNDPRGSIFLDKYSDWVSAGVIKGEYKNYVEAKVKDINQDLKSIFS